MSKNLCPENNLVDIDSSYTVRFETNLPAGTYTASAIVESTDTDGSTCLMLFYYADNTTTEVYIGRSSAGERVSKTFTLVKGATKVRIYAGEGYNPSVGDTYTFANLQIEAGSVATSYVPYGEEEELTANIVAGKNIVLGDSKQDAFQGLKLFGHSSQSGVPSPASPLWINNAGDSGTITVSIYKTENSSQMFAVSTPNALPGIPVESGGNYTDENGQQWLGNLIDFSTGKHTLFVNKEILVNTPNFAESPDHSGFFIWENAVGNAYKDSTHSCILSFAPYGTVDEECAYINGQQLAYRPATTMTAEEVNALFVQMQSSSVPAYLIGQLAYPVESDLSAEQIEAFNQLYTYEGITIVENDQDVWMEIEYVQEETNPYIGDHPEVVMYYMALACPMNITNWGLPTCRETMLLRKLLDPSYTVPIVCYFNESRAMSYLWDLINSTTEMLSNIPKSDKEKYLHVAIGGTVDEMPNPNACLLNYWMNEWLKKLGKI